MREIRGVSNGDAKEFENNVLVFDPFEILVVNDLIRLDLPKDLRALLLQCLDDQGVTHVPDCTLRRRSGPSGNLVHLLPKTECLNAHWFLTLADAAEKLEAWRRYYNEERPHGAIGNKSPITLTKSGGITSLSP